MNIKRSPSMIMNSLQKILFVQFLIENNKIGKIAFGVQDMQNSLYPARRRRSCLSCYLEFLRFEGFKDFF